MKKLPAQHVVQVEKMQAQAAFRLGMKKGGLLHQLSHPGITQMEVTIQWITQAFVAQIGMQGLHNGNGQLLIAQKTNQSARLANTRILQCLCIGGIAEYRQMPPSAYLANIGVVSLVFDHYRSFSVIFFQIIKQ